MDASSNYQDSLQISSDTPLKQLYAWEIQHKRYDHVPLMTVQESKKVQDMFLSNKERGGHIKNLYLRDKKNKNVLFIAEQDTKIDLKKLGNTSGFTNLLFGSPERLMQNLRVKTGAVTPLSMITGVQNGVSLFIDSNFKNCSKIYVHPFVNDRTLEIPLTELENFLHIIKTGFDWVDN